MVKSTQQVQVISNVWECVSKYIRLRERETETERETGAYRLSWIDLLDALCSITYHHLHTVSIRLTVRRTLAGML